MVPVVLCDTRHLSGTFWQGETTFFRGGSAGKNYVKAPLAAPVDKTTLTHPATRPAGQRTQPPSPIYRQAPAKYYFRDLPAIPSLAPGNGGPPNRPQQQPPEQGLGHDTEQFQIDTLVVGAGQAGVAMSEHLSKLGVPHLVLERNRIAEAWRTGRWDSLVANGPAWHDRFPGLEFDLDADAFAGKDRRLLRAVRTQVQPPVRTGVEVKKVVRNSDRPGFTIETNEGVIHANRVVAATGPFQKPVIPAIAPKMKPAPDPLGRLLQPEQLPEGAVLVVGAGSSGVQIAEELMRAGRQVYLSVGAHDRPPRAYRNRDFCWWLGVLGEWDAEIAKPGRARDHRRQRRPRRPHRGLPPSPTRA
jgi:cation diffusion facilitator CzcD-associated flavoprotein CzcO